MAQQAGVRGGIPGALFHARQRRFRQAFGMAYHFRECRDISETNLKVESISTLCISSG
ncbi:hypothetical protein [Paenirhodobacter sp.]|uniref:hypothetical protein n=1 Tax=Paenirhodobacter sp. TaxID=1965326 RepID=UPI003B401197